MKIKNILVLLVLTGSIFSIPSICSAADLVSTVNELQNSFYDAVSNWVGPLQQVAGWLLMTLATISFTWQASFMLLRGTDIQELTVELVRMILFTGFFYWLIQNAPDLTSRLINGWIWLAGEAGGSSVSPNIGQILARGVDLADAMYEASSGFTVVVAGILGIIIVFLYVLIAAKAFLVTLEMYTVTAAGVILLGFGGNQWTGDYAKRYITYTMATGMKLFVMYLIVATGENFINAWAADSKPETYNDMLSVVGVVLLMLVLVWQLPDITQSLLSGASLGRAEQMGGAAVTGAAGMLGGAMAGAAMGAAGGALAVAEALKNSEGMPGSDAGFQYKAMNALGNLAEAGAEVLGNRIMGDYNASSGSLGGSMAQHMRQKRTGGSGLYGGTSSANDHIGGASSGGSFGAGGAATKGNDAAPTGGAGGDSSMQTVAEYAENAGYASPAGGHGVDQSEASYGGLEQMGNDNAELASSSQQQAAYWAGSGSDDPSDNPATRYRSPAVDLTKGGMPSYEGYGQGATPSFTANNGGSDVQGSAGVDAVAGSGSGSVGVGVGQGAWTGAAGAVSAASYLRSDSGVDNLTAGSVAGVGAPSGSQGSTTNNGVGAAPAAGSSTIGAWADDDLGAYEEWASLSYGSSLGGSDISDFDQPVSLPGEPSSGGSGQGVATRNSAQYLKGGAASLADAPVGGVSASPSVSSGSAASNLRTDGDDPAVYADAGSGVTTGIVPVVVSGSLPADTTGADETDNAGEGADAVQTALKSTTTGDLDESLRMVGSVGGAASPVKKDERQQPASTNDGDSQGDGHKE